jgi:hypothetical protein
LSRSEVVLYAALIIYLIVAAVNPISLLFTKQSKSLSLPVDTLRSVTGSDQGFGFYAPSVALKWRVTYDVYFPQDDRWESIPYSNLSGESRHCWEVIGLFLQYEESREPVCACLAASIFGSQPDAALIIATVEVQNIPSPSEYEEGVRPEWIVEDVHNFARHKS